MESSEETFVPWCLDKLGVTYPGYLVVSKFASPEEVRKASILQALHANWKPSPWQIAAGTALFRDGKKDLFLQCGRKSGKSEFLLYALIRTALEKPNAECYYCAPYLVQAKELITANNRLQNFVPRQFFGRFNKSELRLTLTNGSFIKLGGADNPDSFRGIQPDIWVLDELANISEQFIQATDPNRNVKRAPVIYAGTPPARENVYTVLADKCQRDPDKFWIQVPTTANPHIDKADIEKERISLYERGEQDVFAREFLGQFVIGGSRAIFPMLDKAHHVVPYSVMRERIEKDLNQLLYYVVCDPGSSTTFAVLLCAHNPITQENFIFNEIYEQRSTHTTVSFITDEVKRLQLALNLPEQTEWNWVCDEAATWFRNETMERYPDIFVEPTRKAERPKDAGLSLMKDLFLRDKLLISNACPHFFKELQNYVKKDDGSIPKKGDHLIDACRYFLGSAEAALGPEVSTRAAGPQVDDDEDEPYYNFLESELEAERGRPLYSFEEDGE